MHQGSTISGAGCAPVEITGDDAASICCINCADTEEFETVLSIESTNFDLKLLRPHAALNK